MNTEKKKKKIKFNLDHNLPLNKILTKWNDTNLIEANTWFFASTDKKK